MASVGYGLYTYGKSHYGTPVYHFGVATSAQTSSMSAVGRQLDVATATLAQTSSMSATGVQLDVGSATLAQTSSMTATGVQIDLGTATIAQTSGMSATGTQIDKTSATIAQTSSMTGAGKYTVTAAATIAGVSDFDAIARQIDRGKVSPFPTGDQQEISSFSASGGLKWTEQVVSTTWTTLGKEEAA